MQTTTEQFTVLNGGEWLIKESSPTDTFIPEAFNEEQMMIRDMCNQFLDKKYFPFWTGLITWNRD